MQVSFYKFPLYIHIIYLLNIQYDFYHNQFHHCNPDNHCSHYISWSDSYTPGGYYIQSHMKHMELKRKNDFHIIKHTSTHNN